MPTFQLDGREIPFEKGDTIIQAAHRVGIDIPHYCWHPGLSVAANCRMCLVEVLPAPGQRAMSLDVLAWDPKLQDYVTVQKPKLLPACQTAAAENMVVKSDSSEEVVKARRQVQEFLLLNHPVDCPICDQAGECRLQDYWLEHQHAKKRMHDEIVHKPKAVSFGPTIVYDAERCIVCTRCVRFCEEVAKDSVLAKRQRGNLSEITVSPGRQLDNDYTLMTEFVCPVGALTAKDFRFKARVWFLRSAQTVCMGCATGCNAFLDYDPRTNVPYRHRPRENAAVNGYWMCDEGMLSYQRILDKRLLEPHVLGAPSTWEVALAEVRGLLTGVPGASVAIVMSAQHSSEDNFALRELGRAHLGATGLFVSGRPNGKGDEILMDPNKNPNMAGVTHLEPGVRPLRELLGMLHEGRYTHVLVLGADDIESAEVLAASLKQATAVITLAAHQGPLVTAATVALPVCTWAEADGTYVNRRGSAQQSERAIAPRGSAKPAWQAVADIADRLGYALGWRKIRDVRNAMNPEASVSVASAESR